MESPIKTSTASRVYASMKDLMIKRRRLFMILAHTAQAAAANYLAFMLRFEFAPGPEAMSVMLLCLPLLLFIRLAFYLSADLYKNLWRYASVTDLVKILWSSAAGSLFFVLASRYALGASAYPRSVYVLDWLLFVLFSGGSRFLLRVLREHVHYSHSGRRVLVVGAGDSAEMIVRDMKKHPSFSYKPIGFMDNDPLKAGCSIHGLPIFGANSMAGEVVKRHRPDEVLIAIPSAGSEALSDIYSSYKPFKLPIKILPKISDIIDGKNPVSSIRPLKCEDLLERKPVRADISKIRRFIAGKTVLITGAGGSIGSELSRQIIGYGPRSLVMLDRYENGLHAIDMELRGKNEKVPVHAIVADIQDVGRLDYVFSVFRPLIVFHAAAHKHVPLMEHNPVEAVKNNIFGTKNLIDLSVLNGVESFVMISTDKAVNPTSVMGASKRAAELMTLSTNGSHGVKFTTVRFGNVLGSNGSVLHTFREQIKTGGPVTVTHPDIKRFFMLIPEASQLVLSAAAVGNGGEIFVLDMGEQIRIFELAENLIRLSGLTPHEDIKIEFCGLRPGEKLYEELFDETEEIRTTAFEKLNMAIPRYVPSPMEVDLHLKTFAHVADENCVECLFPALRAMVPTFKAENSVAHDPGFRVCKSAAFTGLDR